MPFIVYVLFVAPEEKEKGSKNTPDTQCGKFDVFDQNGGGGGGAWTGILGTGGRRRRVVTHPVQEREVFELAAESVVDGIHIDRYVDVRVVEVHRIDEHDGADHVHGDVGRR